jgi:Lar family restriction alleviation protein
MKPCPFCGSVKLNITHSDSGLSAVECEQCGAAGPLDEEDAPAVERWDQRTAENARLRAALETISDGASSFGRWQLIARTALKDAAQSTPARDTLKADCCTHCLSCAHFDPARSWCSLHRGTTTPDYLCKDFACATLKEPNVSD